MRCAAEKDNANVLPPPLIERGKDNVKSIKTTLHPEGYHGRSQRPPYFEGWYYKIIDAAGGHRYAVIPGIFLGKAGDSPHSFVQVLDGVTGETDYYRYATSDFHAAENQLAVTVGPNTFSAQAISLDLESGRVPLQGRVTFGALKPWPVTLTSPGVMGWYAWVPGMECYHGVLSFDHTVAGKLSLGTRTFDFVGGRGYIEKDWGQSFPSSWIWTQTNHFPTPGVSLMASIAIIPWMGRTFPGFIVGLLHGGTLLRFASYTGAVTRHLAVTPTAFEWVIEDRLYRLRLAGHHEQTGDLRGPSREDMGRRVAETLSAQVDVELRARHNGAVLFHETGRYAGMELGGDVAALAKEGHGNV
jgi:hypothetical protein